MKEKFMIRESFAKHIKALETEIVGMSEMVVSAVNHSVDTLKRQDVAEAEKIIAADSLINKKRWEIEERCINLIALQQPVATDLREIIAVLSITTDLERMGDYAEGIAKIVVMLGKEPPVKPLVDIPEMAKLATSMLRKSMEAFVKRNAEAAKAICNEDDNVDRLYDRVYHELLTCMIDDPKTISKATPLIWAAHNLERIADRVTNICERIAYLSTGTMQEINVSKY
jgi:phosphate transport system protein